MNLYLHGPRLAPATSGLSDLQGDLSVAVPLAKIGEMAEWVKRLAVKPEEPGSIPRPHNDGRREPTL